MRFDNETDREDDRDKRDRDGGGDMTMQEKADRFCKRLSKGQKPTGNAGNDAIVRALTEPSKKKREDEERSQTSQGLGRKVGATGSPQLGTRKGRGKA